MATRRPLTLVGGQAQELPNGDMLGRVAFLTEETTIASAATVNLGAANTRAALITGTTTITSFGNAAYREVLLRFAGALTLTNSSSLALPGGVNITTTPGDTAVATSDASGNWILRHYSRAVGPAAQALNPSDSPTFANTSLDGPSSAIKYATFKTSGKLRFAWLLNNASETGSNAGGNLELATFADDGSYLATPLRVSRATGEFNFNSLSVLGRTRLQTVEPGSYTIGTLPAGIAGAVIYVADAVKRGEASGSATGCLAQYSKGFWRRILDDSRVEFPPTLTRGQLVRAISAQLSGGVGAFQQAMISSDADNINSIAFFHEDLAPYDGFLANQVRAYCQTKLGMSSADAETKIAAMYAYAATIEPGK